MKLMVTSVFSGLEKYLTIDQIVRIKECKCVAHGHSERMWIREHDIKKHVYSEIVILLPFILWLPIKENHKRNDILIDNFLWIF